MAEVGVQDEQIRSWADWAGDLNRAAVHPQGRQTLQWALDAVTEFYGDEWFARYAARRALPVMTATQWPLSTRTAVVRLLERAARLAVAPKEVRKLLAEGAEGADGDGIRSSNDLHLFGHLDLVLEVVGLAVRDGWSVEAEAMSVIGRRPDLRITKGTMTYTIEVTRQGHDRNFHLAEKQSRMLTKHRLDIETTHRVECSTRVNRLLEESEFDELVGAMVEAAARTAKSLDTTLMELEFASVTAYPAGERPLQVAVAEGPLLADDLWPRLSKRLQQKAEQTADSGPTWLRVDELGGLLLFTQAGRLPIEQQLALLTQTVRKELSWARHIQGLVISHGAEADWNQSRPTHSVRDGVAGTAVLERVLPGVRRRRTFVIPVHSFSGLALPNHLVLLPTVWYATEDSWLDWALNHLGHPAASVIVSGEPARTFLG